MAGKYSDEQRAEALRLLDVERVGTNEVGRRLGIPAPTISRWAKAAGVAPVQPEHVRAAQNATRLAWATRRKDIVDRFGEVAAVLLDRVLEVAPKDGRDLMWSAAVAVDKAQLLSGAATSRHEVFDVEKRRARVAGLTDELAARRAAREGSG